MKLKFLFFSLVFVLFSCEDDENLENDFYLLTKDSWAQYFGEYNGVNYPPLKLFEKVQFKTNNDFELIKPNINDNDTVWGTFEILNDSIVMDSYRKLLFPYEDEGTIMYKDSILNYKELWQILTLNEEYLIVDNKHDNFAFKH